MKRDIFLEKINEGFLIFLVVVRNEIGAEDSINLFIYLFRLPFY